jgi:hypothetical protein
VNILDKQIPESQRLERPLELVRQDLKNGYILA